MPSSSICLHRTHRPWGMVLAVLALCMQLWAGQATAAHFGQALVDGAWRSDVCRATDSEGIDSHTLQALCISEHCPACSAAGHNPLPPASQGMSSWSALPVVLASGAGQKTHPTAVRLRPPAQAPPASSAIQASAAAIPLPQKMTLHTSS